MSESAVRVVFLGDSSSAVRSVSRLESAFGGLGRTAKLAAGALAIGIVGGLAAATKAAVDFDKSMRNVNSIAKLSEGQFQSLEKRVLALGKTTGQTPKVLADGLYDIVSSGFKANDAIKILSVSAKAATAGMTDTATASKAVVAILNAYHLGADKARNVSSLLFKEVQLGVNTFEELATNIGDTAPLAAALKIPFSDVSAGLALITLHGTSMAEAATQMSRVMADLLKPSKGLSAELKKLGYENGQAAIQAHGFIPLIAQLSKEAKGSAATTADWFQNIRSLRGMLNLTGPNLQMFNKFATDMARSFRVGGDDVKAFNEQSKSISVQWAKAKSAIIAASIPIGQMLFPLLSKAAVKGQEFAQSLQAHMPEIKQNFQELSGIVAGFGQVLLQVGRVAVSPAGSSALLGGIAAVGTGNLVLSAIGKFKALQAGMGALGPAGTAAAIAVGLVTGALVLIARSGSSASDAVNAAARAIGGLANTAATAAQSQLDLKQAQISVATTADVVKIAEQGYAKAVQDSGRNSFAARQALHQLQQARQSHKQALHDEQVAVQNNTKAHEANQKQLAEAKQTAANVATGYRALGKEYNAVAAGAGRISGASQNVNKQMRPALVADYASKMGALAKNAADAAAKLAKISPAAAASARNIAAAARMASELAAALGRIPTTKEITFNVRIRGAEALGALESHSGLPSRTRAAGGFIPGPSGAPVPILAHAGEVVLNREQQQVLGGAQTIASMFGFRGDEGPGFAAGGIVNKPKRRRSGSSPHHKRRPRVRTTNAAARAALTAVDNVNQREDDLDRAYGQLARGFDITQEVFIRTDADGNDYISQPDITQRVGEIDQLIASRNQMLALLDEEKKDLAIAIAKLRKAIDNLLKAIAAERKAAQSEAKTIAALNRQLSAEQRKKKPNQNLVNRLQAQVSTHQTYKSRHEDQARNLASTVSDFRGAIKDEQLNLVHTLPFDRRDVTLDIQTLQAERFDVSGTKLSPTTTGGGGGATPGPTNIDDLLRQIGVLKLALGIQGVQQGIIGSFAGGTLNVPQTGLALVHAGETITPAHHSRDTSGPTLPDIHLHVIVEDGAVNADKIKAIAVQATDQIALKMGNSASERVRSNRY
jgi:TP901 family phage tail tape measure protein